MSMDMYILLRCGLCVRGRTAIHRILDGRARVVRVGPSHHKDAKHRSGWRDHRGGRAAAKWPIPASHACACTAVIFARVNNAWCSRQQQARPPHLQQRNLPSYHRPHPSRPSRRLRHPLRSASRDRSRSRGAPALTTVLARSCNAFSPRTASARSLATIMCTRRSRT